MRAAKRQPKRIYDHVWGERMGWAGAGSARGLRDRLRSSVGEQGEGSWKGGDDHGEHRDGTTRNCKGVP